MYKDLQQQVRDHIKADKLYDWDEAFSENEMTYLENLLLTFNPICPPGSIGYEEQKRHIEKYSQPLPSVQPLVEALEKIIGLPNSIGMSHEMQIVASEALSKFKSQEPGTDGYSSREQKLFGLLESSFKDIVRTNGLPDATDKELKESFARYLAINELPIPKP